VEREYKEHVQVIVKAHCGHASGRRPGGQRLAGLRGGSGSVEKAPMDAPRSIQDIENRDFLPRRG
jgi:hypothetical protein